jgi:RNA polymerase sigma factor (sigma-70 family)
VTDGDETEEALITASVLGDTEAFGRLVSRYQQRTRRLAIALVGATEGDDVAQDSFVRAYRSLGSFRRGAPFEPWLRRIVVNQARNHHRGSSRRARREHVVSTAVPRLERTDSPQKVLDEHEQRREIERALAVMSESDRVVISLRFLLDYSEQETAEMLGWPKGTVKSRTSRALVRLRSGLARMDVDE